MSITVLATDAAREVVALLKDRFGSLIFVQPRAAAMAALDLPTRA